MTKAQSICLVNVSLAVTRRHKQVGEQSVSLAYTFTSSTPSLKGARAGHLRHKLVQRQDRALLPGLLLSLLSLLSLLPPGTITP